MVCPNCGAELADRDRFCPWCGAPQQPPPPDTGAPPPASEGAGPASRDAEIRELRAAVNTMTNELARLSLRLSDLERGGASTVAPPPQQAAPATPPEPRAATPSVPAVSRQAVAASGQAGHRPATPITETATAEGEGGGDLPGPPSGIFADWNWEWLLGGNWLARIGIVAIIFGVAFFISLAIDRGWLGEAERVILGVAAGLAFIGGGEYFRRRYGVWAQTVTGGGIAILYLSVYGAFALYGLISTELAFGAFAPHYAGRGAAFTAPRGGGRRRAVHLRRVCHSPAVAGAATGSAAASGLRAGAGRGRAGTGRVPQLALVHPAGLGRVADSLRVLATGTGTFHWIGADWHYRHIPRLRRSHHCLPHRAEAGG